MVDILDFTILTKNWDFIFISKATVEDSRADVDSDLPDHFKRCSDFTLA